MSVTNERMFPTILTTSTEIMIVVVVIIFACCVCCVVLLWSSAGLEFFGDEMVVRSKLLTCPDLPSQVRSIIMRAN